jgi:ABC-type polysaccharide/polyol phosphate transport system ATPase subunit
MSAPETAIVVDDVTKRFRVPRERVMTLKERALHPFKAVPTDELAAIDSVSFEVAQGEFFAVVGRNGSGKSTLLKCLAGIYAVDGGQIYLTGRVSTFIELGVGFNMELAARENIVINGTMLGLTPREARRRTDEVLDFAELREFADLRLKNYSSGMLVRLAFAVMIQVDADVLLIDEVLAVGDAAFQQKCYDEFARLREEGRTVLLVTHDMGAVERFCDRALLLERGRMAATGSPHAVGLRYMEMNFGRGAVDEEPGGDGDRFGDGRAEILEAWFEDDSGSPRKVLPSGPPCSFAMRVRFLEDVDDPIFGVTVLTSEDETLLGLSTLKEDARQGRFAAGEEVTFRAAFENVLRAGRYFASPAVAHAGSGVSWIDRRERFVELVVSGTSQTGALIDLPYRVSVDRDRTGRAPTEALQ